MTPNDLILYILDGEGGNEVATIDIVNEFIANLLDENKTCSFAIDLADELEEFATSRGRCPNCGSRLIYKKENGNESEYFGLPVTEECTIAKCEDCNFEQE